MNSMGTTNQTRSNTEMTNTDPYTSDAADSLSRLHLTTANRYDFEPEADGTITLDWGDFRLTLRKEVAPGAQEVTVSAEALSERQGVALSYTDHRLNFKASRGAATVRLLHAIKEAK
jgi:hypothetical protein